jgi:fatty-acyl-CoA synthase
MSLIQTYEASLDKEPGRWRLPAGMRSLVGGAAVPEALIRAFDKHGIWIQQGWGMTETSPLGTISRPTADVEALGPDEVIPFKLKQGRAPVGVELKLTNDEGRELPHDGTTFGRLKIRGATIAAAYFKQEGGNILDEDGFFDTGDVSTIDQYGFMQITDRAKDVIKSGGEWISSIEIENIAAGHPKSALAAVIGIAHPKWDERPVVVVVKQPGAEVSRDELLAFFDGKTAKWQIPDDVIFIDAIPLGATGKMQKVKLRETLKDYSLPTA